MHEYDDAVLECFLENQLQLFPENVAETPEEAEDFLEECMAVVVDSLDEVWDILMKKVWIWKDRARKIFWMHLRYLTWETADI